MLAPLVAAVTVWSLVLTLAACRRVTSEQATPQARTSDSNQVAAQPPHKGGLPGCPDGISGGSPLPAAAVHHKVVLSWNPSVSAGHPGNDPVGYCLYRRKQQILAKKLRDCKDCEQVTPKPIIGTGCVDNLVKDGQTYFYVAITINPGEQTSEFSNQTMAVIPPDKESLGRPSSYPLCRELAGGPVPLGPDHH
jgi:hypothetical protein